LYIFRNGNANWRSRQTKSRKENSRTPLRQLDGNFVTYKQKIPMRAYRSFTFVLSENVFHQGMVVLLNPVCVLLSGMLHVYKRDTSVAVFET